MKRTVWMLFAALVAISVVASAPAAAQFGQGRMGGGRMGPGGPQGPGRGPGGPGGPGGLMPLLQQLNLTDAQRDQVRAIMDERRDERPGGNMPELQQQLQAAIFANTPDTPKIDELKAAIAAAQAAEVAARIDTELRIAQILTPEQRAKARELVARGPGPRGREGRLKG